MNAQPRAVPGATRRAQPATRGRPTPEAAAGPRLARTLAAQVSADDEYEPTDGNALLEADEDISEGWPDGWEGDEVDAATPYGDDPPLTSDHFTRQRPAVSFFGDSSSARGLKFEVEPPNPWLDDLVAGRTPWIENALNERRRRLHDLARTLRYQQGEALTAPNPREAYLRLNSMSKRRLDDEMQLPHSGGWSSRNRAVLVACPWGTVPLDFFSWGLAGERVDVYEALLTLVIGENTQGGNSAIARRVLQEVAGDDHLEDTIRKLVPVAKGLVTPEVAFHIATLRRSCLTWSDDALESNPSVAEVLKGRGKELARFAVAGWKKGYEWTL